MPIALLLTTAATGAVGVAVLRTVLKLRRQLAQLQRQLDESAESNAAATRALLPNARSHADTDQIRAAVAEALAEERERELAEARAFWAAQEARDASDAPSLLGLSDSDLFLPRQADFAGLEPLEPVSEPTADADEAAGESPELAAARRRHPSHPDFVPVQSPVVNDHERTATTLEQLAAERTELSDVRPGPLGTLDVYVFADGTTLCMTPGHRETAEHLAAALRSGESPYLLGGSGISGSYTLTFACGKDGEDMVYVLADRVIASL
ncbi:LapA family protein [Streptomyces sp. NPDC002676]